MPIFNLKITNPQALEFIAKIKSGEIKQTVLDWFKKTKWYFYSAFIILILIIALFIGKAISEKAITTVFTPPDIENPTNSTDPVIKSIFSGLKENIEQLNTDLPDPFIPSFENNIDLEEILPD